jgi:hypothetical protein
LYKYPISVRFEMTTPHGPRGYSVSFTGFFSGKLSHGEGVSDLAVGLRCGNEREGVPEDDAPAAAQLLARYSSYA